MARKAFLVYVDFNPLAPEDGRFSEQVLQNAIKGALDERLPYVRPRVELAPEELQPRDHIKALTPLRDVHCSE